MYRSFKPCVHMTAHFTAHNLLHNLLVLKVEVLSNYSNYDTIFSDLVAAMLNVTSNRFYVIVYYKLLVLRYYSFRCAHS